MKPIVGIVPAAGLATRLQPLAQSKEMLRLAGKPVIDLLVNRMQAAQCSEIRVVTRPAKADVAAHATALGATVVAGEPESVGESIALGMSGVRDDARVLLGFPDTVWEPPNGFGILLDALTDEVDVVLGLFTAQEPERSDVVVLSPDGLVSRILVKPKEPPSDLIWGCAAARTTALRDIGSVEHLGELFDRLAPQGRIRGVYLSDSWLDIGTKEALSRAQRSR